MKKKLRSLSLRYRGALRKLKQENVRRVSAEQRLEKSNRHHKRLLDEARALQSHFRRLSRKVILAQEEERREISRELHDEIAQVLSGINVHLATLQVEALVNSKGRKKIIASTQRLVEKSVNIVHRFARDLRPPLLDDLGLIPALQSYIKEFEQRAKVSVQFKASADVEKLNFIKRTVLYRVAQAALTNVAQHAGASLVNVTLHTKQRYVCLEVKDNGRSFHPESALFPKKINRLGLLGMRERVEMVRGRFQVESVKSKGTTIHAEVPL